MTKKTKMIRQKKSLDYHFEKKLQYRVSSIDNKFFYIKKSIKSVGVTFLIYLFICLLNRLFPFFFYYFYSFKGISQFN